MTPTPQDHEAAARKLLLALALPAEQTHTRVALIAAALAEAVRVARLEEREACCRIVCWWCGNDYGMWEPTPVRIGPDWKHRAKDGPPAFVTDCAASRIRARSEAEAPRIEDALRMRVGPSEAQATPAPGRCPHCSFSPESASDYCDEHRPKGWGTPPETKERG